ncbi:MAG: efflux RND transporter permease subunit [Candidatus Hydrogenedentota bacterium]|nr:MAG: efflux RND transporter permease subunit [Candidatus Hydrogenedentota bacterium]
MKLGWSAEVVKLFLQSNLSLLLLLGSLVAGAVALAVTPREEDPQIVVPVVDVRVAMPGAEPEEIERLAATPLESILSEIPGVENVYSMSFPGGCLVTVRFYVGEDREKSLTKVFTKLEANRHRVPPGVPGWQVFPVDIADVPIVTVTLFSETVDDAVLREIGNEVLQELRAIPEVARSEIVGGRRREVRIQLDPGKLSAHNLSLFDVVQAIQGANEEIPSGELVSGNVEYPVRTGPFLTSVEEVRSVVVGITRDRQGRERPVQVKDVGRVIETPEEPVSYTRIGFGPGAEWLREHSGRKGGEGAGARFVAGSEYPAVTLAIAKRKGSNAVTVARAVEERLESLRGGIIPSDVDYRITRDYGETANHKVNELVKHLAIAIATVVILLGLALGWREAWVVALAVPMTLAVTLAADMIFGYSINRVTLFALILSLGLLVDDPIVDVENIYRHFKLRQHPPFLATLIAVDEIRPPTVLATLTVIVAFLPMFFITGMMGPYMAPMAFNVPMAMLMSLLVAFTVTPWAAYYALRKEYDIPAPPFNLHGTAVYRGYRRILAPLLDHPGRARLFLATILLLFLLAVAMVPLGLVPVKILPFDNKNELLLVLDMPEGTPLEKTDVCLQEIGRYLATVPEVVDYESYAGLPAPIDFNGLVRHYFLRHGGNVGDIRVNLLPKEDRKYQAHALALRIRPSLEKIARRHGGIIKIVETPPGPPVLSTLVTEVYGPKEGTYGELVSAARKVKKAFAEVKNVSDIDWTVEDDRMEYRIVVDRGKAARHGISVSLPARAARVALEGDPIGGIRISRTREPIPIRLRLPAEKRSEVEDLLAMKIRGRSGVLVPLGEIVRVEKKPVERTIYHKDLKRVIYVTAEPVGISPVDALFAIDKKIRDVLPEGYRIKWRGEGEWKITVDVFRDLGLAFAAALVMIYILLVAQTGSMIVPVVIMLSIPLTMIGVFPGFGLLNLLFAPPVGPYPNPIFFTAPGMIGLIALAGIVVRNSIILIDFVEVLRRRGLSLHDALIEAGATRLRPILLTAAAALFGAWVIVLDPIFSGLAWSFIFGIFASTGFTLLVVPVVYFLVMKGKEIKEGGRLE